MPRRRREHDPERVGDELPKWDGNHSTSRVSSRRRRHRSFDTRTFPSMLASAALDKDEKHPLYTVETNGKKTIRLRTLQHMIVCNLRRDLAGQVKIICDENSEAHMEDVRKKMKHYGLQAISVSLSIQIAKYLDSLCPARPWIYVRRSKPRRKDFRFSNKPTIHNHPR